MNLHRIAAAALLALALAPRSARADDPGADYANEVRLLYRIVACTGDEPLPAHIDKAVVDAHCKAFLPMMAKYKKQYLPQVEAFLAPLEPKDLPTTVVYPFGGGDLNSALTTYPNLREVTTMSLEHAGDPRRIRTITKKSLESSLRLIRETIAGLVLANDSKSVNLSKGQRGDIPGQIAFFVVGLALHDLEPVGLRYFRVNVDGSLHYFSEKEIAANEGSKAINLKNAWIPPDFSEVFSNSEITFVPHGKADDKRVHRHIAANLANDALTEDPSILHHLEAKGPVAAMTKAASYLLWNDFFSKIRDYLLTHMVFMVSDSTGIPPKFAEAAGFKQTTYGHFESSFLPSKQEHNDAFRKLWATQPQRALPFRYGYLDGSKHFHMLITERVGPAPVAAAAPDAGTPAVALAAPDAGAPQTINLPDGGTMAAPTTAMTVPASPLPGGAEVTAKDEVAGGRHWRILTDQGAVHVWRPPGYREEGAGTIVYAHGYYANVDQAWNDYHLAEQFLASGRNAWFIVPESPTSNAEEPVLLDLPGLLRTVSRLTRSKVPDGTVVAMGHSGGYRSIVKWLDYQRLTEVILLDGLYNNEDDFRAWLTSKKGHKQKRLVLVSAETLDKAEAFLQKFPLAAKREGLPTEANPITKGERFSQVLHIKSQADHMALVTDGKAIPAMLAVSPVAPISGAPAPKK